MEGEASHEGVEQAESLRSMSGGWGMGSEPQGE